jgi:hypothetical protein
MRTSLYFRKKFRFKISLKIFSALDVNFKPKKFKVKKPINFEVSHHAICRFGVEILNSKLR